MIPTLESRDTLPVLRAATTYPGTTRTPALWCNDVYAGRCMRCIVRCTVQLNRIHAADGTATTVRDEKVHLQHISRDARPLMRDCRIGANWLYIDSSFKFAPGLTGALGVPFYTEIVDSGGDSLWRRNHDMEGAARDNEATSAGARGAGTTCLEGRDSRNDRG